MTEDVSTLKWQPEIKQAASVDSEDIPMVVYYANHGNFQRGEDAGCLRCAELLRRGKSTIKHKIGCPASSKNSKRCHDVESNRESVSGNYEDMLTAESGCGSMTEHAERDEINSNIGQEVKDSLEVLSNNYNDDVTEQVLLQNSYQMDVGCLSSMEGSCDLSNFDHDYFNVEEAVVHMYEKTLNYTHNGNYGSAKAPPTVRTESEARNVVAYFKFLVNTPSGQLIERWLTKDEAIEVSFQYRTVLLYIQIIRNQFFCQLF